MAPKPKGNQKPSPSAQSLPPIEDLFTTLNRHIQRSEFEQAVKVSDQVLSVAPGDEDAIRCKVVALIRADNFEKALAFATLPPSSQIAWNCWRYAFGITQICSSELKDIEEAGFLPGEEVSLESLKEKCLINPLGRERRLPLKILAVGKLSTKLNIKARAFSAAAKEKLEAASCTLTELPGKKKWLPASVLKNLARANEYFDKKRAAAAAVDESPSA